MLTSFSARGHINPLLALAAELRRRDHRVAVAIPHSAVPWVTAELARVVPVVGPIEVLDAGADGARRGVGWWDSVQAAPQLSASMYDALLPRFLGQRPSERPDVFVVDFMSWSAMDVAESLGIPCVEMHIYAGFLLGAPSGLAAMLPHFFSPAAAPPVQYRSAASLCA